MIGTFEALRAPLFLPAQRHAAMGAGVEQYSDTAVIAPHDQTGILPSIATDKIARIGNFAFVRDRQPGTGEYSPHFQLEYFLLVLNAKRNFHPIQPTTLPTHSALEN